MNNQKKASDVEPETHDAVEKKVAIFVDGKELKEGETIKGHMDDHKKHVKAYLKMEKKLKTEPPEELVRKVYDKVEKSRRVIINPRRPQLPKKLIVLSVEWDISYFDKQIEVDAEGKDQLFGQVNYENNTIRIFRGKRKKECIFETIFHEWVHIVMTNAGYRYSLGDKQEEFTEAISTALNDLFWRNFR